MSFKSSVAGAPAPWAVTALGTVISLVVAFAHLTPVQSAVLYSIGLAAGTIITAARTRPVAVTSITGAAAIILGDLAIANVHLSSGQVAALTAGISLVLGALLHLIHVPVQQDPSQT